MSFERRPSQRYPRRGKANSNNVSSTNLHIHSSPQQQQIVHNVLTDKPEFMGENTVLPNTHRRSNLSLNQREDPVILPNPNHQVLNCQQYSGRKNNELINNQRISKSSQEKGVVVDVHRPNEVEALEQRNQAMECINSNIQVQNDNLRFELNDQDNRIGNGFQHSVVSKRISSSSSGGYSATDEVDYLKWVSETKGQLKHHINKKTDLPTNVQRKEKREQERTANKYLNSSSSGVSSVESCPVEAIDLENHSAHRSKQYPPVAHQKRSPSINSSSSGHGSPEDSVMGGNILNCDDQNPENQTDSTTKHVTQHDDSKKGSPISSISRINSSSPDSGYEHVSSTGNSQ